MGYAVCHRDVTGTQQVEDVSSLEAAVELVERLRNEAGPADVRVFREVPIEVRTYYKVVLADEDGVASSLGPVPNATTDTASPEDRVPPAPTGTVDELPGAFPLGTPTGSALFEQPDGSSVPPGDGHRRANRFGRGG
jgi:hypothetical protein